LLDHAHGTVYQSSSLTASHLSPPRFKKHLKTYLFRLFIQFSFLEHKSDY